MKNILVNYYLWYDIIFCLQVDLNQITISDDMAKLLNSIKAQIGVDKPIKIDQPSPFHLPPLEPPYDFKDTDQDK